MRIDVLARRWGAPTGGPDGMAIAAAYFAEVLEQLGHQVRRLPAPDGWAADLVVSAISATWRRVAAEAQAGGAIGRLIYWHHHGGLPPSFGCALAAPPAIEPTTDWSRAVVLPPSSWAAEARGDCVGDEVLVAGAGPAKGGHVALAASLLCPDLRWYVLPGRCSSQDLAGWLRRPNVEVAPGPVEPAAFLARARAVIAPTRFDVHPLLLVEAAVRGIPIVTSDLPGTRAAAQGSAYYLPVTAAAEEWAAGLRRAIEWPLPRLRLPPYRDAVAAAIAELAGARAERAA